MENQEIENAVEFVMSIMTTRKFELLYSEYEESDDDQTLRDYIRMRLETRNK